VVRVRIVIFRLLMFFRRLGGECRLLSSTPALSLMTMSIRGTLLRVDALFTFCLMFSRVTTRLSYAELLSIKSAGFHADEGAPRGA